jgi:hypothetical protein
MMRGRRSLRLRRGQFRHNAQRHEARRFRHELAPPLRVPPLPQEATADVMPTRHVVELGAGLVELGQDLQFHLIPPMATPLDAGDDLHSRSTLCPQRRSKERP